MLRLILGLLNVSYFFINPFDHDVIYDYLIILTCGFLYVLIVLFFNSLPLLLGIFYINIRKGYDHFIFQSWICSLKKCQFISSNYQFLLLKCIWNFSIIFNWNRLFNIIISIWIFIKIRRLVNPKVNYYDCRLSLSLSKIKLSISRSVSFYCRKY